MKARMNKKLTDHFEKFRQAASFGEVLHAWAKRSSMSLGKQAEALGVKPSTLANAINRNIEASKYPARLIVPHTRLLRDCGLLDWMEASLGRVALDLPDIPDTHKDTCEQLAAVVQAFGRVLSVAGMACKKGPTAHAELVALEAAIAEHVGNIEAFALLIRRRSE